MQPILAFSHNRFGARKKSLPKYVLLLQHVAHISPRRRRAPITCFLLVAENGSGAPFSKAGAIIRQGIHRHFVRQDGAPSTATRIGYGRARKLRAFESSSSSSFAAAASRLIHRRYSLRVTVLNLSINVISSHAYWEYI